MTVSRRVSVQRNRLHFAAAHMATFGGACEPLHGHNYEVSVELEGPLTDDSWVWDFSDLKRATRELCEQLDHRFLLQRESRVLDITETEATWEVAFGDKRYSFPKGDVAPLPIDNTTAERLAEWIGTRLWRYLSAPGGLAGTPGDGRTLTVGVEEMPGQAGWYTVKQ
ncbi:MAG: 6-pyruvoyl trahydropterin synthase family protein [Tepidiformaceae bacterium]